MSHPQWGYILTVLIRARKYGPGLDIAESLPGMVEAFRPRLEEWECNLFLRKLRYLELDMLDRLDQWERFLEAWQEEPEGFLKNAPWPPKESRFLAAHWAHLCHRKRIIERKLQAPKAAAGNLLHRPSFDEDQVRAILIKLMGDFRHPRFRFFPYLSWLLFLSAARLFTFPITSISFR